MKVHNNEHFFKYVRDFLTIYLPKQRCCSQNTIKAYKDALNLLINYLIQEKKVNIRNISFNVIDFKTFSKFIEWIGVERGCGVSTQNHRIACIRSFYNYVTIMDPTLTAYRNDINKLNFKKSTCDKRVEFMSEAALKAFLSQPNTRQNHGIRNQFFIILMYDTGARNSEILNMRVEDFNLETKAPYVHITGKGGKKHLVPIMQKTVEHFNNYMKKYHANHDSKQYLFYTKRNGQIHPMSDDNVGKFIKKYGIEAKKICPEVPGNVHPHMLRHTRAMHLYHAGMPLSLISEWLGHAQLETTMIYAYADTEMKRKAIEKATKSDNPINVTEVPIWQKDEEVIKKLYGLK